MKYSFDELKQKISIIEIAEQYGYKYQKGEGVRVPIYRHENGDKIGIFNPNDSYQQRYFNLQDGTDKGSLYNFVQNRLSNGIITNPLSYPECNDMNASINAVLHNYLNVPLEIRKRNQENIAYLQRGFESKTVNFAEQITERLEHREFFYGRGITDRTLDSELFKGKVFNLKDEPYSMGFPIWREGEMVGLEKRNKDIKKFFTGSDKSNGIWHSNVPENIKSVFVAETPLDCIAHRQLKGNDDTLYISFGGNLCATQILTINKLLNQNRDKVDPKNFKFLLGADNDKAGTSYDLAFILTQMSLQGISVESVFSKDFETQRFELTYKDETKYNRAIEVKKLVCEQVKVTENEEKKSLLIEYPNKNMFAERNLCQALLSTNNLPYTKLEKAVMKDWNDDVMVLREINKKRQQREKLTYSDFSSNKETYMKDCSIFEKNRLEKKQEQKNVHKNNQKI